MRQRGRRSSADLSVNGAANVGLRLESPSHLTAKEQRLFREAIANTPSGQFSASDVYLLSTFVQITSLIEGAATSARKASDKTRPAKFKLLADLAKTQSMIATKPRLTPSARTTPRTAGRAHDAHRPSAYDTREWEFLDDHHNN